MYPYLKAADQFWEKGPIQNGVFWRGMLYANRKVNGKKVKCFRWVRRTLSREVRIALRYAVPIL
jgi:hypothetical protein